MTGTNATTGKPLSGFAHFRQSVTDILQTPVGSRVMLRGYGSNLYKLIDNPANAQTIALIIYETALALLKWEPRLDLKRVICTAIAPGKITVAISGNYLPDGKPVSLDGITISAQ